MHPAADLPDKKGMSRVNRVNELRALSDTRAVRIGSRIGVSICADLLRDAGAVVQTARPSNEVELRAALLHADIAITSSDVDPAWIGSALGAITQANPRMITVDITGAGTFGPLAGLALTDLQVQAMCGLMDSTGVTGGPPTAIGFPVVEVSAGIYGAIGAATALLARDRDGIGQAVDVALYDCAVNALTTFLPKALAGGSASRIGNRHPLGAPWNTYPTRDGWALICAVSEDQWARLSGMIGPALALDTRFRVVADRVAHVDELDALVSAWTSSFSTLDLLARCEQFNIPCAPIIRVEDLPNDPNIVHREMIHDSVADPGCATMMATRMPGVPFKMRTGRAVNGPRIAPQSSTATSDSSSTSGRPGHKPVLRGVRVVEVGQYTTAPLVAKNLAALGAEVIKVEPAEGDATRFWKPGQGDMGYFFAMTNTDKSVVTVDLKDPSGRDQFCALLRGADVLVENMRPGALERLLGAGAAPVELNPALIHCAISGFGVDSAYPGRPAFDTIAQAMCGMMDLTRAGGVPTKAGISAADILGGQVALFAILCSLRDGKGPIHSGASVDLAMQDVGVWATYPAWSGQITRGDHLILTCPEADYVAEAPATVLAAWAQQSGLEVLDGCAPCQRPASELAGGLDAAGVSLMRIRPIADVLSQPHFIARCLTSGRDTAGTFWPLVNAPYRLRLTPAISQIVPGALGADNARVFGIRNK